MTLHCPNNKDILPRLEQLAQDQTRRNVEYAIDQKKVVSVAKILKAASEGMAIGIKKEVNGNIKELRNEIGVLQKVMVTHNTNHEADMKEQGKRFARMEPVIEAYETAEKRKAEALTKGKTVVKVMATIAGFITIIGTAYLTVRDIIWHTGFIGF